MRGNWAVAHEKPLKMSVKWASASSEPAATSQSCIAIPSAAGERPPMVIQI